MKLPVQDHVYDESFTPIILPFSTWKALTGLVSQNAKLGPRNINQNNEKKVKLENSDSEEDYVFIKDKPLNLQIKKNYPFYKNRKVLIKICMTCAYCADELNSAMVHSAWLSTFLKGH